MTISWSLLQNKYMFATLSLVIWLLFFDANNIFTQLELRSELKDAQSDRDWYIDQILKINKDMLELTTNPKTLEKFAREKYLMKKDNEVIFVFVEESENLTNQSASKATLDPF